MKLIGVTAVIFVLTQVVLILDKPHGVVAQEPFFELPVELVGFPVIIVAVRLSNFVKKLAYSLNPTTYVAKRARRAIGADYLFRSKRSTSEEEELINMIEAEKRLVTELGNDVCIYPKVCLYHAQKSKRTNGGQEMIIDWDEVFNNYKISQEKQKEFYLLSVFLGDFIASPKFCNQLVKRGRACKDE